MTSIVEEQQGIACWVVIVENLSRLHPCLEQNVSSLIYNLGTRHPSDYVMLVGFPVLLAIGLISNILYTVFVLSGKKDTTKAIYLTVLAISGTFLLLFEIPRFVHVSLSAKSVQPYFLEFMMHSVGLQLFGEGTFMLISNWTVVAFSLERIIVISNPIRFHYAARQRFAFAVIGLITAGALGVSVSSTYLYYKSILGSGVMDDRICTQESFPVELEEVLPLSKMLFFMQGLFATVFVPLVTLIIMTISTIILIVLLIRARSRKQDLQSGQKVDIRWSTHLTSDGTLALLRTLIGYFTTQVPRVVFLTYRASSAMPKCYSLLAISMLMQNRAAPVIHFFFLINYAVTFLYHNGLLKDAKARWQKRKERGR